VRAKSLLFGLLALGFPLACGKSEGAPPGSSTPKAEAGAGGDAGRLGGAAGSHAGATGGGGASGKGSSAGASMGGSAGAGTRAGQGGAGAEAGSAGSGTAGRGGLAGATMGGSAGREEVAGGAPGGGAPAGGGGNAGTPADWQAACDGLTVNGRCDGDTYQWCDYFTRQVGSMDCGALGMTCRALETESNEEDGNGCVGAPCDSSLLDYCAGQELIGSCFADETVVTSCAKHHGSAATCSEPGENAVCSHTALCDGPSHQCDGSVIRICDEDGQLYYRDCARMDPAGTCAEVDEQTVSCGGVLVGFAPL